MSAHVAEVAALDVLRNGRHDESLFVVGRGYSFPRHLPRIECADGFHLSAQASELHYSTPRDDTGPWTHVEVGYPSERPEPWAEWSKYVENEDDPTGTVYARVPLSLVEQLVVDHGGAK